jgi:hypothetical protein
VLRRFLIAIALFLVVVVVAADRVGAIVGAHVLASKLQTDEHLPSRPSVSIHGIPFLTQAFGGRYDNVSVVGHNIPVNGVPITTLTVHMHGAHVPFGKVVRDSVSEVPVDQINGTAFVSFDDADSYLSNHRFAGQLITLEPGGHGTATVNDRTTLAGRQLTLHGVGAVSVAHNIVSVAVSHLAGSSVGKGTRRLLTKELKI